MPENLIMRGKTSSGETETLNFSGHTPGYAYRLVDFKIYPAEDIGSANQELAATVTAAKTAEDPSNPNFNNPGLIATALWSHDPVPTPSTMSPGLVVVNDMFYITQDLILRVIDTVAGAPRPTNWQCRFEKVKLSSSAEAVANFNQFTIFDG